MRGFRRLLVALAAASVAAKTGTTPDPMYELDAVCADWWHPAADGCFDSGCFPFCGENITGAAAPGTESTDDDRQGCFPFCGDKSDAPPPTPKPTTTLAKGGKADGDEDESDGSAALSHSLAAAVVALLAA